MAKPLFYEVALDPRPLRTEAPATAIPRADYVSVQHEGLVTLHVRPQEREVYRLVSRAPEGSWAATRLEKNRLSANFQGNPLWPARILKPFPKLSAHFGLVDSSAEQTCVLPMTATINARLRDLGLTFGYKDAAEYALPLTDQVYVDTFIDDRRLPMADVDDRDSIHDWSYHFITFLFEDYLENIRLSLEFIRQGLSQFQGTTRYAWNYYGHAQSLRKTEALPYREALYRQMAVALDVGTAKFVQLIGLDQQGLLSQCQRELAAVQKYFHGVSPAAVASLLYMEKAIALVPPVGVGVDLGTDPMHYLVGQLNHLEKQTYGDKP